MCVTGQRAKRCSASVPSTPSSCPLRTLSHRSATGAMHPSRSSMRSNNSWAKQTPLCPPPPHTNSCSTPHLSSLLLSLITPLPHSSPLRTLLLVPPNSPPNSAHYCFTLADSLELASESSHFTTQSKLANSFHWLKTFLFIIQLLDFQCIELDHFYFDGIEFFFFICEFAYVFNFNYFP